MKRLIIILVMILTLATRVYATESVTYKLDNGQTLIVKEVKDNPIVIIDTWIKTGSVNETDENNGVAHFLEHLFFKGTSLYPAKEFDSVLESKGAITNAATSKDFTHYYILIPSKYFDLALKMHSDMLLNPLIPRKELEKERKVVLEEIAKNNDKPTTTLYKNMTKEFYKNHPYKRDVIGTKEVIENITREQILDFYNKWYVPSNMITVVAGDVNATEVLEKVKKSFNQQTQAPKQKKLVYKKDKKPSSCVENKVKSDVETGYVLIGFKSAESPTDKDSYALDVLATIIGDGKTSRLYKNLKEQKQLVHSVSAYNSSMKEDSLFYISANYTTEDIEKLKNSVFNEIENLKKNEVPSDELEKAKKIIERDTFYSRESISNIAGEIGYTVTITDDIGYYKNYLNNINKVTTEDIKRVAKEYLDKNSAVISIVMPKNSEETELKKVENKENTAKLIGQNDNTSKYLLDNGITLTITKNTTNDIVATVITVKGGNNLENIPGTASLTADVMMKGTKKYTNSEFSQILEENGIKLGVSASGDTFAVVSKYTKNQKDIAFDLIKEIIGYPRFDNTEIEKAKTDKLISIKNIKNMPESLAFDEFKTAMWEGTPYGNTGKVLEKTINKIQKKDIEEYYNRIFTPQNIVITVNGNVDEKEYINYFSNLLKKTTNNIINTGDYKHKYKDLKKNKIIKINKATQATWIIYGWLTDGITNEKDWAAMQLINSILGSGMSSRLFTNLRDEKGLAYQVGSTYSANYNKGALAMYIATNPKSEEEAKKGLMNEINKIKTEFITNKELNEAKDKLLGNFVLSMETNMDKALTVNSFEINGKGYDYAEKYADLINSVTLQDIIKTANKYFSKPYVLTISGPDATAEKM